MKTFLLGAAGGVVAVFFLAAAYLAVVVVLVVHEGSQPANSTFTRVGHAVPADTPTTHRETDEEYRQRWEDYRMGKRPRP